MFIFKRVQFNCCVTMIEQTSTVDHASHACPMHACVSRKSKDKENLFGNIFSTCYRPVVYINSRGEFLFFFNSLFTWQTSDSYTGFHVGPRQVIYIRWLYMQNQYYIYNQ